MKKVLSTLAVGLVAVSAFAQGTLVFNAGTSNTRYNSGSTIGANSGQVQFGWAAPGVAFTPWTTALTAEGWLALNPGWTIAGVPVNLGVPAAGKFTGGTLTVQTATPGALIQGIVIGWTGTGASSWLAGYDLARSQALTATTGQFNISSPFSIDTGDPTTIPAGTAGSITAAGVGFTGLTLTPIPEPSSFALAGLGAAALMIFRRRK